jgi:hypothetical protein
MLGFKIGPWDYITFAALVVIVFGIVLFMILILGLPGKIAIARKHPEADCDSRLHLDELAVPDSVLTAIQLYRKSCVAAGDCATCYQHL